MMKLTRKQHFILMACINSIPESAIRDLCRRFDFGNCNRAPIKNIRDRVKKRLAEYLIEPAVVLPVDKLAPKDQKVKRRGVFAIKVRGIFATKNVKLDKVPKRKIRKVIFNG